MSDLGDLAQRCKDQGLPLTPFGQLLLDIRERNREPLTPTREQLDAIVAEDRKPTPQGRSASISADLVRARLHGNRKRLEAVERHLAALMADKTGADPAVVNLPQKGRGITEAQLARWRELTGRRDSLRHKIGLDEARLERFEGRP